MSLPINLHGEKYYEGLKSSRDAALVESHLSGKRNQIAGFTFGRASAEWQLEEGGTAHLQDVGLRHNGTTLTYPRPTTLRLLQPRNNMGIEAITFKMDIDDTGCIDVYRNIFIATSFLEFIKAELSRRKDKKHGLLEPNDEERELLYTEMQRGATGLYPISWTSDN